MRVFYYYCYVHTSFTFRYFIEQQNADLAAEGVVTYPHPIDSQSDSPVFNSSEIHVFMNRSDRNYLSLQGEHQYDISYGAGHGSFISEDKDANSSLLDREDQFQATRQFPTCLAGPSTSYSSQTTEHMHADSSMINTSVKLCNLSLKRSLDTTSSISAECNSAQLKEAKQIIGQTPYQVR